MKSFDARCGCSGRNRLRVKPSRTIWGARVRKFAVIALSFGTIWAASLNAATLTFAPVTNKPVAPPSAKPFVIKDPAGKPVRIPLVDDSEKRKIVAAKVDPSMNPMMVRAATIAQDRAYAHSKSRCWRYVKEALLAAGAVSSYPKTALAKQAGEELMRDYGFKRLPVGDPYAAPVGSVLVYGGPGAGHVEIRHKSGFVSDFKNEKPSKRRLIGVFAKA